MARKRKIICLVFGFLGTLAVRDVGAGTWVGYNDGLRNLTVIGISIAPSQPETIYVQCRGLGVYKSTDGGTTWSKTATFNNDNGPGFDHLLHHGPAVHPTNPDVVWAASGGRVYKTASGGASWSLSSSGTTVNGCDRINGILVNPNDPDHLLAGTIASGCDGGVFESTDGGAAWTNIAGSNVPGSGIGNDAWPLAWDANDPLRVYSGSPHNSFYRSVTGGVTWINRQPVSGDHSTYDVVINPALPQQIWCDTAGGTWVSNDYGVSWSRQTHLFGDRDIDVLRFAPSDAQIAYAIVGDTIWRSSDNGVSWNQLPGVLGGPRCLEIHPTDPDIVFLGTWGLGLYRSTDGGQTFTEANTGLPLTQMITSQQVFGDLLAPGALYCVLSGNIMYRLEPGATEWTYYGVAPDDYIKVDRFRPTQWYCASGGLWRSPDEGQTWEEVYTDGANTSVFDFWLDPLRCGRILVGDRDNFQIAESLDSGDTWNLLGSVPIADGWLSGVVGDPYVENNLLVAAGPPYHSGSQHGYIWRSTDRGQSWTHIRDGMFYANWRIGNGFWQVLNNRMVQNQTCCCGYHVNLDGQTFGDGIFEVKTRILDAQTSQNWSGFTIRLQTRDDSYQNNGWLVYMRQNGVVALYNGPDGNVINAAQTPVVTDTSQWVTLRLEASGNMFTLYANGVLVGSYTDPNHRYDNAGYFALETCRTQAEFDDLSITAESTYTDTFSKAVVFAAAWGRWLDADPHTPGRFALSTQWGGFWYTRDHGATWEKISPDDRNGYLFYIPKFSHTHAGNVYVCNGSGTSWRVDNFHDDGYARQRVGQNFTTSSVTVDEDPYDVNRLYASIYNIGVSIYDDSDIAGIITTPPPRGKDLDGDFDVDMSDHGLFQACLSGDGFSQSDPLCAPMRFDSDDDVDAFDMQELLDCMTGPGIPAAESCLCTAP